MSSRQFIVERGEAGSRLDRWLTSKMPEFSRGQIKHLLDQGKILVNHRRVLIAGWELETDDAVEVRMPPGGLPAVAERPAPHRREQTVSPRAKRRDRFLEVLFEDRDLIVVHKPAGILTEPKSNSPHAHLFGMIQGYLKRKHKGARGSYVKLLHRLDRETSGVLVAAKSKAGEQLQNQFRSHQIDRQYIAVVEGAVEKEAGTVRVPLEKGDFGKGKKVGVAIKGDGRRAITNYRVKERYSEATLLALQVQTGRTHQIRVHLSHIGHPIVGDSLYGSGLIPFSRQALHAALLRFHHPRTRRRLRFEAKLPNDLQNLIDRLRGI